MLGNWIWEIQTTDFRNLGEIVPTSSDWLELSRLQANSRIFLFIFVSMHESKCLNEQQLLLQFDCNIIAFVKNKKTKQKIRLQWFKCKNGLVAQTIHQRHWLNLHNRGRGGHKHAPTHTLSLIDLSLHHTARLSTSQSRSLISPTTLSSR